MFDYDLDSDGIVTLTWDLPDRPQNVFNADSIAALEAAIDRAAADPRAAGVILTSGKRDFAAGADLPVIEAMARGDMPLDELTAAAGALGRVLRKLETCGKPVVAAIPGTALGGGFELALACHHRVCVDDDRIKLGLPEVKLGLLPGAGGTQRVPRMIGVQAALPLLLEGKEMRPGKAAALGLVDAVVPTERLLDAARAWLKDQPVATQPWDRKGFQPPGGGPRDLDDVFTAANAMTRAKTWGLYPAPEAILACVYEGIRLDIDSALAVERQHFVGLLRGPVAGAMIRTLFLNLNKANKLARRPADPPRRVPSKVGVLGAGLMGSGIAYVTARAGIDVVLLDRDLATAEKGRAYSAAVEDRRIARRRSSPERKAQILERIHPTADYADLAGCDLVVEAVFEDREVKADVTARAVAVVGEDAVFGSNTSTLPITGLAEASPYPHRFVGLHFFSPVEKMPLVEVIVGQRTAEDTLAWALDYVAAIRKTPIVVNDSRGFYTSRVFGTYVTEGMALLAEGVKPALIENAGRAAGMPMPPLALADEVGIGLLHQVAVQTRKDLGEAAGGSPSDPVLATMVEALGRRGRRAGGGFYDYDGKHKRLWPGLAEHFPVAAEQPALDAVVERYLFAQCVEAARCVEAGVLRAHEDADVGAILGWGFAPWTGGPLSYIDRIGAAAFAARARELAAMHGERFAPPELVLHMAAHGGTFYP